MQRPTPLTVSQLSNITSYVDYRTIGGMPAVSIPTDTRPNLVANGNLPTTLAGYSAFGGTSTLSVVSGGGIKSSARSATSAGIGYVLPGVAALKRYYVYATIQTDSPTPISAVMGVKSQTSTGITYLGTKSITIDSTARTYVTSFSLPCLCGSPTCTVYINNTVKTASIIVKTLSCLTYIPTYAPTPLATRIEKNPSSPSLMFNGSDFIPIGFNLIPYYDSGMTDINLFYNSTGDNINNYFSDLADTGANTCRLTLWYKLFEDDATPGVWKTEIFEYLNTIIALARSNGIALIFDMHAPPGGYQSPVYSGTFWANTTAAATLRTRLKNIWIKIAQTYKDEPYVMAFDLINEPNCPTNSQLWTYYQELYDAIHPIAPKTFILCEDNYSSASDAVVPVNGNMVIMDAHCYPNRFCDQYSYTKSNYHTGLNYPSDNKFLTPYNFTLQSLVTGLTSSEALPNAGWYKVSYTLPTLATNSYFGKIVLGTNSLVEVRFDRVTLLEDGVKVYDSVLEVKPSNAWDTKLWETTNTYGMYWGQNAPSYSFTTEWASQVIDTGATGVKTNSAVFLNGKYSLGLKATTASKFWGVINNNHLLSLDPTKTYTIEAYVNTSSGATVDNVKIGMRYLTHKYVDEQTPFNKANIEKIMECDAFEFQTAHGYPVNIGEIGVNAKTYDLNGGKQLMLDMLGHCKDKKVGVQVFGFKGEQHYALLAYGNPIGLPEEGRRSLTSALPDIQALLIKP